MKNWLLSLPSFLLVALIPSSVVGNGKPINVLATLRGKKYDIINVSTVRDLQKSVEDQSGLLASKQGVLFGGQKLKPADVLQDVGVEDGGEINIVPSSNKKKSSSSSSSSSSLSVENDGSSSSSNSAPAGGDDIGNMMEGLLKQAGIDSDKFDEMMKSMTGGMGGMGGMGGGDGEMPDMKQSMDMMKQMMSSPMFQDYFKDPEKLEQSRQMILQNPMMKGMMANLPGFDEILNDPVAWRETMMAAVKMYSDMGSMMDGAFGGLPEGNPALDELSEGDE